MVAGTDWMMVAGTDWMIGYWMMVAGTDWMIGYWMMVAGTDWMMVETYGEAWRLMYSNAAASVVSSPSSCFCRTLVNQSRNFGPGRKPS